ncbi:hypothetical protein [Actinopolyspora saharensis]|uniref:hypothetical protein n=1 Tax=Actinopolyspora saharensis TaxID=995062 RepID=UPI003F673B03
MKMRSIFERAFTGAGGLTRMGGALLLLGTVASQHPNPSFDRIKNKDVLSSLFPNWRFFAPEPAQHDYHIIYRTLDEENEVSQWNLVDVVTGRKFRQIAWFPDRRTEKAVFDIATELITNLEKGLEVIRTYPSYCLLQEFVRKRIDRSSPENVKGFQFGLIKHTGYDESTEPEAIFVSPYTPMKDSSFSPRKNAHPLRNTPDSH